VAYVLSDLSEEHYKYFASLKGITGHLKEGIFIAEGPKVSEHVLRSNAAIAYALMTQEYFEQLAPALEAREGEPTYIHIAPKAELEKIIGFSLHKGLMLAARIPTQHDLHTIVASSAPQTIVILEGIADAENMGTLVRTAAAFGVDAVIVDQTCCHPFLRRAVRVSMGTVINVPIIYTEDLKSAIQTLKDASYFVVAAALGPHSLRLQQTDWQDRTAIILGAEGVGITAATLRLAHVCAMIPMQAGIDSLNVGVACGVFLNERSRAVSNRA
jgi:tRNA G18 (ribose-2'-O)-methylase SpoU